MNKDSEEIILNKLKYWAFYALIIIFIALLVPVIINWFLGEEPPPRLKPCNNISNWLESQWIDPNTGESCEPFTFIETPQDKVRTVSFIIAIILIALIFLAWIITNLSYFISSIFSKIWLYFLQWDIETINKVIITNYNIEEILDLTEKILNYSKSLSLGKKLWNINISSQSRNQVNIIYANKYLKILDILKNIKEKLNTDIDKIQSDLELAQNELISLSWNEDLIKMKSQQSIRLDKQIEQFEELQKVLVKV